MFKLKLLIILVFIDCNYNINNIIKKIILLNSYLYINRCLIKMVLFYCLFKFMYAYINK